MTGPGQIDRLQSSIHIGVDSQTIVFGHGSQRERIGIASPRQLDSIRIVSEPAGFDGQRTYRRHPCPAGRIVENTAVQHSLAALQRIYGGRQKTGSTDGLVGRFQFGRECGETLYVGHTYSALVCCRQSRGGKRYGFTEFAAVHIPIIVNARRIRGSLRRCSRGRYGESESSHLLRAQICEPTIEISSTLPANRA